MYIHYPARKCSYQWFSYYPHKSREYYKFNALCLQFICYPAEKNILCRKLPGFMKRYFYVVFLALSIAKAEGLSVINSSIDALRFPFSIASIIA